MTDIAEQAMEDETSSDDPSPARWHRLNGPVPGPQLVERPAQSWRSYAIDLGVISAVTTVVLKFVYDITSLRIPFAYGGDGLFFGANAKTIIETGWVQESTRLGAPFGQKLYDFPIGGDNGNYLVMRVFALFTGDWALISNLYFLFTFYASALAGYVCFRWLRVTRTWSVVCGLLFGLAPFHFARLGHPVLANYAVIAIAVVLALRAAGGESFREAGRRYDVLLWGVACIAVGSFNAYWAVFGLITIVLATGLSALAHRTIRPLLHGAGFAGVIGLVMVLNQAGTLLNRLQNGSNHAVGHRDPINMDVYGLRIIQMITPVPGGRLSFLNGVSKDLSQGFPSEFSEFFGVVGSVCFLLMLGWFIVRAIKQEDRPKLGAPHYLAALTVLWILLASTGGLNWLAVLVGFNRIRGWNRASILIMFCALAWGALHVEHYLARANGRLGAKARLVRPLLAAGVLALGLVDQTSGSYILNSRVYESDFRSDQNFFVGIEAELPVAANVFLLPIRSFPEEPATVRSSDYDLLRPFLQTKDLRWSYGGMRGREAEWQQRLVGLDGLPLVESLVAVGFDAVVIDRNGYADGAADLEDTLSQTLGARPHVSENQRFSYFSLLPWSADNAVPSRMEELRHDLLEEPILTLPDCSGIEGDPGSTFTWCGRSGQIELVTPLPSGAEEVSFAVSAPGGTGTISILQDGSTKTYEIGPEPVRISVTSSDERYTYLDFETDVSAVKAPGDARDLRFIVSDVRVA